MSFRIQVDDDLILEGPVEEPPWEEGCVRLYARRFAGNTPGAFAHLGSSIVDLLFCHEFGETPKCIRTKVAADDYRDIHSVRMARLVNAAIAGGGTEIGIVGFGYFEDER